MQPLRFLSIFLGKYFFILKAASDGWRVCYKGGNEFKFDKMGNFENDPTAFIQRYSK